LTAVVKAESLTKRFGEVLAVTDLLDDLEVRRPTLEYVYMKLTADDQQGSLT
jgi:hypothetical protein